ncbi:MAG: ATP-binding protein [Tetrasphaera sp.]
MDGLFSAVELDAAVAGAKPGFRLTRLEVLNWGTFDGRVSRLDLDGETTLLTGDIGSGKSTLVDAVTTLLLPANRINYNKAAGADNRERDLRSYVQGHYKSERIESTGGSRAVGLRDHRHHSVILGVFTNEGYAAEVTLAQVFWTRDTSAQPNRFFVTADRPLSIAGDFTDFGSEIAVLKRRLRAGGADIADHFPDYGTRLRRLLGIGSEQALELLHQTISMKAVGNLTDFVRQHMLEGADAADRISTLVGHFDNLTRAHDAVRRAKDQLAGLDPIVAHCDSHAALQEQMDRSAQARTALRFWIADRKGQLLATRREAIETEIGSVEDARSQAGEEIARLHAEQRRLELARDGAGGSRLAELTRLIDDERSRRADKEARAGQHAALLAEAGLDAVADADGFARARAEAHARLLALDEEASEVEGRRTELAVDQRRAKDESDTLGAELRSLRGRSSNIDARNLAIREALRAALGVAEAELPFVGELIQVRAEHEEWRGAAERVLRGFALSVLVPAEHYDAASAWVDANHLGGRLVYYRVPPRFTKDSRPLQPHTVLADLLDVLPGPFADWVTRELGRRADHACAASIAELRTHARAVTRAGQVKSGDGRHEKDDRFRIDDRTRWVLGWSNEDKIDALLEKASGVQRSLTQLAAQIESCTRLARKLPACAASSTGYRSSPRGPSWTGAPASRRSPAMTPSEPRSSAATPSWPGSGNAWPRPGATSPARPAASVN